MKLIYIPAACRCRQGRRLTVFMTEAWSYRRDRWGESWHIVPANERGEKGRTLCGEPRQGTPLSEGFSKTEPQPPESLCDRCLAIQQSASLPV